MEGARSVVMLIAVFTATLLAGEALSGRAVRAGAPAMRYSIDDGGTSDRTDDTVVDTRTGLLWQRNTEPRTFTRAEAGAYCAELKLAAHGGFRLPTRRELVSLVDYTRVGPSTDIAAFPDARPEGYWTSTAYVANPTQVGWRVEFLYGIASQSPLSDVLRARCVR